MAISTKIHINNDLDVVTARMQARQLAKQMGFNTADQARISLAASELARVLSWNTSEVGEMIMSNAAGQNGYLGFQVVCLVNLKFIAPNPTQPDTEDFSIPRRSLAGACQLVDESIVEEQGSNKARITLIKWLT